MTDKKRITFYVEPIEYDVIMHNARAKGFTRAGDYARNVLFSSIAKYGVKGVFAVLDVKRYHLDVNMQ